MNITVHNKANQSCRKCFGYGKVNGDIIDHDEDGPVYGEKECSCVEKIVKVDGVQLETLLVELGYRG